MPTTSAPAPIQRSTSEWAALMALPLKELLRKAGGVHIGQGPVMALHPELDACHHEFMGIPGVFHPLVHQLLVPPQMYEHVNFQFLTRVKQLQLSVEQRDWARYISTHEKPYRFDALWELVVEHYIDTGGESYWELVSDVFTNSENVYQNLEGWIELLSVNCPHRTAMMNQREREALHTLPDTISIYRGYSDKGTRDGLSWTTDEDKAEWFARRFTSEGDSAYVAEGTVAKTDVIAYLLGRGESEILTLPGAVTIERIVAQ